MEMIKRLLDKVVMQLKSKKQKIIKIFIEIIVSGKTPIRFDALLN